MKKLIFPLIGLMGLVGVTSCSQDDVKVPAQDGVTFTVQLPRSVQSRGTFGDGTDNGDRATLNNLQYSVYEVTNNVTAATPLFSGAVDGAFTTDQTQETVTIPLAKGKSYQVVFYADDSDNDFVTYTDGTINVVYANSESNVAAEDAFVGKSEQFTVNGAYSETVTLTRPFAQLNWGSDDTDAKVLTEVLKTLEATVTVSSGLYTSMDVLTGTVSDQVTTATTLGTVSFASLPEQTFPVAGTTKPYALIAMNYLLTGNGTINCELSFSDTDIPAVEVSAAPVQINHRTNIYGSLLTNPGTFNIIVDNNFADPDNNYPYPSATTAQELNDYLLNPDVPKVGIPTGTTIDISSLTSAGLNIVTDKEIVVEGTIVNNGKWMNVRNGANVKINGGGTVNCGSNSLGFLALFNSNAEVENITIKLTNTTDGVPFAVMSNSKLDMKGVTVDSDFGVVQTWNGNTGGEINAENCTFISRSNSPDNNGSFTYAFNLNGENQATLTNCNIYAVQGAVAATYGASITIDGGFYGTFQPLEPAKPNAYYAFYSIYTSSNGKVTVKNGDFYTENKSGYCTYATNPSQINLEGGYYSAQLYVASTGTSGNLPEGYVYKNVNKSMDVTDPWGNDKTITLTYEVEPAE